MASEKHLTRLHLKQTILTLLGVGEQDIVSDDERRKSSLTFAVIGFVVVTAFSLIFVQSADRRLQLQGLIQLCEAIFILLPAILLAKRGDHPERTENLLVFAGAVIFPTITLFGGFDGDGIYWTFAYPYLVFFLKGQRVGWLVGAGYALIVPLLMAYSPRHWGLWVYHDSHSLYYGMAYLFSVLTAAHFNLLRSAFQARLREQVDFNTCEAKRHLASLEFNATHDVLTGLPNRQGSIEAIAEALAAPLGGAGVLHVVTIKFVRVLELAAIVGMKKLNAGLIRLAGCMRSELPQIVSIGRIRQDELVLLMVLDQDDLSALNALNGIEHLRGVTDAGEFSIHDEFVFGVASQRLDGTEVWAGDLLRKAEQALLYAIKNRQRCQFYDDALDGYFLKYNTRYQKVRNAIFSDGLQLHYQPQVDLRTRQVVGAEALVRWFDADEGMIPPDEFIPIIESTGLLHRFSIWTIKQAMHDCAEWQKDMPGVSVSINLSADALHDPDVVLALETSLQSSNLNPSLVIVELTESVMLKSPEMALVMMQSIVGMGMHLSIDDYGAGFSSLTYVKQLPAHELKIDKSFISDLINSQRDRAIVESSIDLGHDFGLKVLAEGIEDEATMELLLQAGCDLGQGWYFAKALSLPDLKKWAHSFK